MLPLAWKKLKKPIITMNIFFWSVLQGINYAFNQINLLHAGKLGMPFSVGCLIFHIFFSKNSFHNTIRVSNTFDPDQVRHFVESDLDPNCSLTLSADGTSTGYIHSKMSKGAIKLVEIDDSVIFSSPKSIWQSI